MEHSLAWSSEQGHPSTRKDIIRWWEARRLGFNAIIGAVGVASWILVLVAGSAAVKPGEDFEEPLMMIAGLSFTAYSPTSATPSVGLWTLFFTWGRHEGGCTSPD